MAAGIGCGGNDGNSGRFSTSFPPDRPISGLSADEAAAYCVEVRAYVTRPDIRADECELAAFNVLSSAGIADPDLPDAELRTLCMETYTACLPGPGVGGFCDDLTLSRASCSATIAEMGACLEAEAAQSRSLAALIPPCQTTTRAELEAAVEMLMAIAGEPLPACDVYQSKCVLGAP